MSDEDLIPGTRSGWHELEMPQTDAPLPARSTTDVCIVGAGITGLSTAYLLLQEGVDVVVLDTLGIGAGETGRSTAHLASALDDRFARLELLHGVQGARMAAQSHALAIDTIEEIAHDEQIACRFRRVDGYLCLDTGHPSELLDAELAAARRAGLEVERLARPPLPGLGARPCLVFHEQAEMHPLRYLAGLARAVRRMGGRIHVGHHVEHFEGGLAAHVDTTGGQRVSARALVVATNTPVNNRVALHTKQASFRSYVVSLSVPEGAIPHALYWDTADPYHYARLAKSPSDETRELLLVGGEDHRTGQDHHPEPRWDRLVAWARDRFPDLGEVVGRWSGQIMEPADGLAFIGRNPGDAPNVFVATGDSGHGLTHGTIAALMFAELVEGRSHPWAKLYDPSRFTPRSLPRIARQSLNTAVQYADWLRPGGARSEREIGPNEGATLVVGGQRLAVYRDEEGVCHRFSAACPHLGGVVAWNSAERSWDCPCHGSRFDAHGHVINGPAQHDLAPAPEPIAPQNEPHAQSVLRV